MNLHHSILLITICMVGSGLVKAQTETKALPSYSIMAKTSYFDTAREYAALYNGKVYNRHSRQTLNHPYFVNKEFTSGKVYANGIAYPNVQLLLDLFQNVLVVRYPAKPYPLIIEEQRVDSLYLYDQKILSPSCKKFFIPNNEKYRVLIHEGAFSLIKTYAIAYEEKTNHLTIQASFRIHEKYYIFIDNKCHQIKNKKALLNLLSDKKRELSRFIKLNKLNKEDTESFYIKLLNYYETLIP